MDRALAIRVAVAGSPVAQAALGAILDRRERDGRLPRQITVPADAAAIAALRAVFSTSAVALQGDGRARILVPAAPPDLDAVLYAALGRAPRDSRAEQLARQAELVAALASLAPPTHPAARAFLADEVAAAREGRGETTAFAAASGDAAAVALVADVATALAAALTAGGPVRIQNFAARVLGDSKALAPGAERTRRLASALLAHDPATQADVATAAPASTRAAERLALERCGLLRDDAAVTVHVFGPLVYDKPDAGAAPFDQVARHALGGDPSPLSIAQLRGARLVDLPAARITVLENQTPFLDYVERADPRRELVVLARGQASWAVVLLLRLCAPAGVPVRHSGDLDRSGVLILRSLAARARVPIEPWLMDVATHRRFAAAGRPLDPDERARLARLVAVDPPDAPCHELLVEIARTDRWLEQETYSHALLLPDPQHPNVS